MKFRNLLLAAKDGDQASLAEIFRLYRPLIIKRSKIDGVFDEDLYQELSKTLVVCVERFLIP